MKKVLVTGAAGYIGSSLVRQFLGKGYVVYGLDNLTFGGDGLLGVLSDPAFKFIKGDIRDQETVRGALGDVDSVVHLAAIVGDPACSSRPELARETNWHASKVLFDLCVDSGNVQRFLFASTCSNYGKMNGDAALNEGSPLRPISLYAELKVAFERYLLDSVTRADFIPTALRFATVYGLSARMRFDLTVNEFTREITFGRPLEVFGETFWRPYCHVHDLARSCILVLETPADRVDHNVFNVGDNRENYQKKSIAEEISKVVPSAQVRYVPKEEDPRDYRVDFTKAAQTLGFRISKTVPDGIREIHKALTEGIISDPWSKKYSNS
jgi:nucleoside-diphosphate-sugar epimerase